MGVDGKVDDLKMFELVKKKNDEFQGRWDAVATGGAYPFQDGGCCLGMV